MRNRPLEKISLTQAQDGQVKQKAGTLSVLSRKTKDFQSQDATRLFITNKRIIFVRKQKNVTKSINIQSINLLQFV